MNIIQKSCQSLVEHITLKDVHFLALSACISMDTVDSSGQETLKEIYMFLKLKMSFKEQLLISHPRSTVYRILGMNLAIDLQGD